MASGALSWLRRYLLSFNGAALVLLAFQNAGYLVLMGYAQQLPLSGQMKEDRVLFVGSHFLAITELTKLLASFVWCTVDVMLEMRNEMEIEGLLGSVEGAASATNVATQNDKDERNRDPLDESAPMGSSLPALSGISPTRSLSGKQSHHHGRSSPSEQDAIVYVPAEVPRVLPPQWFFIRKRYLSQTAVRLRHAVGLDSNYKEAMLMVVPAVVYAVQGLTIIYSLQLLDPAVFQVLYQVRILFLALMMRATLDFKLSASRWLALIVLICGIALAQLGAKNTHAERAPKNSLEKPVAKTWSVEGTLLALAGSFLSAFSGVFMEFVFKKRGNHFHLSARNVHLAFFSVLYFCGAFLSDIWATDGNVYAFAYTFFDGFTKLVWFLVVLQAMGGILVAIVMRYCDNIVKSFSTSFAIVLSGVSSVFLFHMPITLTFLVGSLMVMGSITLYSLRK